MELDGLNPKFALGLRIETKAEELIGSSVFFCEKDMSYLTIIAIAFIMSILAAKLWFCFPWWALLLSGCGLILLKNKKEILRRAIIGLMVFSCGYIYVHSISIRSEKNYDTPPFQATIVQVIAHSENRNEIVLRSARDNYYQAYIPFAFEYVPGDEVVVRTAIIHPQSAGTAGVFNYPLYLKIQRISGILQVRTELDIQRIGHHSPGIYRNLLWYLRSCVGEYTTRGMPKESAGLLRGILLGEKVEISPRLKGMFADTGVMHILAVSGLNVGMVAGIFYFVSRRFLRCTKKTASFLLIFILVIFAQVVGSQPSVNRAAIMAIAGLAAVILERDRDLINSLSLAAIIILILNPWEFFDVGFQLSFGATLGLILITPYLQHLLKRLGKYLSVSLAVTLGAQLAITPIIIYYFHKFSFISPLTNLLVVPLVGIITVIGFASFFLGVICAPLSVLAARGNHFLLMALTKIVYYFQKVPFAFSDSAFPGFFAVMLYYFTLWVFLRKWRWQYVMMAGVGVVCLPHFFLPRTLTVSFLDVKQGDSIVICTPGHNAILIDGGGGLDPLYNVGETVVAPYLWRQGISTIDTLILSHVHYNHIQGLLPVIEKFRVRQILLPRLERNDLQHVYVRELLKIIRDKRIYLQEWSERKNLWKEEDLILENVSPSVNCAAYPDDRSLVSLLRYKQKSFLLTSDNRCIRRNELVSVCQVPGHGKGDYATLPKAEAYVVSSKVIPADEKIFSTARDGTLTFTTNGRYWRLKTYRN